MKKLIVMIFLAAVSFSYAQDEYSKTVHEFLEVSGANSAQRTLIKQMFEQFKKMSPNNSYFTDMEKKMNDQLTALNNQLVPVYKKHVPLKDLKTMIKFYKTPAAKTFVKKQPAIMKESMQIGMKWGQQLAQEIMKK